MYNNIGQLIYSKGINSDGQSINEVVEINDLPSGIYLVKLFNRDIQFVENLIIE